MPSQIASAERWSVRLDGADVATLDVPADMQRDRRFEIDCHLLVHARPAAASPWHEMTVFVDGLREWSRRIHTGATDSLDVHFRRDVPAGRALRIVASAATQGAVPVSLSVEAEESA